MHMKQESNIKLKCPIPKILLPVDASEHSSRAVQFAGCLGASLNKSLSSIALLYVSSKGYHDSHIEEKIIPFIDRAEKNLRDAGIEAGIEKLIVSGDPAKEIIHIADEKNFSTIIMSRRGISEIKRLFLGSVTNKILHHAVRQTVYVVGQRVPNDKKSLIPKILVPVDGSRYSFKGVKDAACLIKSLKTHFNRITLLRIINLSVYLKRVKEGIDPDEEARKILNEAKEFLLQAGIPEEFIITKIKVGKEPAIEIISEAEEGNYNLIIMGRKGRSALKDFILGSVSKTVLQKCYSPTVAIVSSE